MLQQNTRLTFDERKKIQECISNKFTLKKMAETIGRARSTIASEIHRNGGSTLYDATKAHAKYQKFPVSTPKIKRAHFQMKERIIIEEGLKNYLSFQQIADKLGRPLGTTKNEIYRNGGRFDYYAQKAQEKTERLKSARIRNQIMNLFPNQEEKNQNNDALLRRIEILEQHIEIILDILKEKQ